MASESDLASAEETAPHDLLETWAVIEQAKGILMATYRCGPEDAYALLQRVSEARNIKVHLLAAAVAEKASRGGR